VQIPHPGRKSVSSQCPPRCHGRKDSGQSCRTTFQEGSVDLKSAVVLDESSEFVHEEIDARTRCANHLSEHFLRNFVENGAVSVLLAVARQQQKSASPSFSAGVEKLIDEILRDSNVPDQHVQDEIISFLSINRIEMGAMEMAVAMRTVWPIRHPSPKKSPVPTTATTATTASSPSALAEREDFVCFRNFAMCRAIPEFYMYFTPSAGIEARP
jgi:hypothetical protein